MVMILIAVSVLPQSPQAINYQTALLDRGSDVTPSQTKECEVSKKDSYGNPIVNETPGLPDWAERDVLALRTEIIKTIKRRETLKQTDVRIEVIHEIEYSLGNFIGQAFIREIEINDILNLSDKSIITENVSESALEYLHYYENEKYFKLTINNKPYELTQYNQLALDFIYQNGGDPDELLKIESEDLKNTPSGEYTMYFSYVGMTVLSGATTIWSGLIPWNDLSSDKPIGFDFYFYRGDDPEANDSVRVSTNGYLSMFQKGAGALDGTDPSNDQITSTTDPDGYLAPWWDDLIIRMQGDLDKVSYKTEGSAGSRVFTVEYYSVTRDGGDIDDYHYFQVKLNEGSNIINFRYGSWNPDSEDNATVGMEDYSGLDGDCGFDCTNTNSLTPAVNVNFLTSTPGYWIGETNTDWLTESNWDDNNVPDGTTDVVIPSGCPNYPVINGPLYINSPAVNTYECYSFKINSGATATTNGVSSSIINRGEMVVDGQLNIGDDMDLADGSVTSLSGTIKTGLYSGHYGISNHYDGSVFIQEGGWLTVEGIIIDTLATFNGNGGRVEIYVEGYTLPVQEIYIYNEDIFFNRLDVASGVNAELKRDLLVNEYTTLHGSLDIHGSLVSYEGIILWSGGEIIINPLSSVSTDFASFNDGSSLVMYSTGPPLPFSSHMYCATHLGFDSGSSTNCTSGAWISVGGNLSDDDGNFFGNISFNGNNISHIVGYPSFRSLSINKTGSPVYYSSDDVISISNNMSIHSGSFNPNGYTVEVDGSWYNAVGDSGFEEGTGTVIFTTGDDISYMSDETFYNIIVNGTAEVESGSTINAINNLDINSELTINENSTLLIGNSIEVNNGGILNLNGIGGNEVLFSQYAGYYSFNVFTGGEISASHTVFEYMSTNGVDIHNGATVQEPFGNCTFRQGIFSGTLLTINNNQNITIDAAFFPENTWGSIHNVSKTMDQGNIVFDNYSGIYGGEAYENDPYNRISWVPSGFDLDVTVFLEGPFDSPDMNTDLNLAGLLPLAQPYYSTPWNYNGTESVVFMPNGNVVDWVLVEIRDAVDAVSATPATIFSRQAAFILNDGSIVGLDGSGILYFDGSINNNLFLVIYHRNHLGVMSASPLTLNGIYSYDFSSGEGQANGGNLGHKYIGGGKYGMIAGDGNGNGEINLDDKINIWEAQAGQYDYLQGDYKLNGQVYNFDKNDLWRINYGKESQVPE